MEKVDAQIYNDKRRILFSTFHKGEEGEHQAYEWLEGYKKRRTLNVPSYVGLKAELDFYRKYRKEFGLTVALDAGESADFSGIINGAGFRIDVSTNSDFKNLNKYEPFQRRDGAKYKVALMDSSSGDLVDLIDVNFPFCEICQNGRLIDIAILLGENYNQYGESKWTNDQVLTQVCSHCQRLQVIHRLSTHFLYDYEHIIRESSFDSENDLNTIIHTHSMQSLKYLKKQFDKSIFGLGSREYLITDTSDADGFWGLRLYWNDPIVTGYVFDEYRINLFDI